MNQLLVDLMAFREQALRLILDLSSTVIILLVSLIITYFTSMNYRLWVEQWYWHCFPFQVLTLYTVPNKLISRRIGLMLNSYGFLISLSHTLTDTRWRLKKLNKPCFLLCKQMGVCSVQQGSLISKCHDSCGNRCIVLVRSSRM